MNSYMGLYVHLCIKCACLYTGVYKSISVYPLYFDNVDSCWVILSVFCCYIVSSYNNHLVAYNYMVLSLQIENK